MRSFGSDNHCGIHPEILKAIVAANADHAPSYGTDSWTERANALIAESFGCQTDSIYYVYNGTAANALAVTTMIHSFESCLVSASSHLQNDECGAPEFFSGGKLISVPDKDGKMNLQSLEGLLQRRGDQHHSQIRAISLTQPTELGTVYTLDEISKISKWAHGQGLFVHMDGARLTHAATTLGCSLQQLTKDCGVDVLSFGGTKNGFLFGEALIFFDPKLSNNFKYLRKQLGQLPSKTRFLSCQFERYLQPTSPGSTELLWQSISKKECDLAQYLFEKAQKIPHLKLTRPRQSNAVFVQIPRHLLKTLRDKFFFYVWDEKTFECRWMISWDTTKSEIDEFIESC